MQINLDSSRQFYEENKDLVNLQECYDNVWRLITKLNNSTQILFCYVQHHMIPNMYFRHVALVEKGQIIDPTLYKLVAEKEDKDLANALETLEIIPIRQLSTERYLTHLSAMRTPTTELKFGIEEKKIQKRMATQGKFILG